VRINCISPGQIDVGVDLHNVGAPFDSMLEMLSSREVRHARHDGTIPSRKSTIERGNWSLLSELACKRLKNGRISKKTSDSSVQACQSRLDV